MGWMAEQRVLDGRMPAGQRAPQARAAGWLEKHITYTGGFLISLLSSPGPLWFRCLIVTPCGCPPATDKRHPLGQSVAAQPGEVGVHEGTQRCMSARRLAQPVLQWPHASQKRPVQSGPTTWGGDGMQGAAGPRRTSRM